MCKYLRLYTSTKKTSMSCVSYLHLYTKRLKIRELDEDALTRACILCGPGKSSFASQPMSTTAIAAASTTSTSTPEPESFNGSSHEHDSTASQSTCSGDICFRLSFVEAYREFVKAEEDIIFESRTAAMDAVKWYKDAYGIEFCKRFRKRDGDTRLRMLCRYEDARQRQDGRRCQAKFYIVDTSLGFTITDEQAYHNHPRIMQQCNQRSKRQPKSPSDAGLGTLAV